MGVEPLHCQPQAPQLHSWLPTGVGQGQGGDVPPKSGTHAWACACMVGRRRPDARCSAAGPGLWAYLVCVGAVRGEADGALETSRALRLGNEHGLGMHGARVACWRRASAWKLYCLSIAWLQQYMLYVG